MFYIKLELNNKEKKMIKKYKEFSPYINDNTFIAKSADVIGNVEIMENANIWYNATLRGDVSSISIGKDVNVQDGCVVHGSEGINVILEKGVTVGHNAIIHGCHVGKYSLIGMGATILDGASIGEFTIIGAGSLVTQGNISPQFYLHISSVP